MARRKATSDAVRSATSNTSAVRSEQVKATAERMSSHSPHTSEQAAAAQTVTHEAHHATTKTAAHEGHHTVHQSAEKTVGRQAASDVTHTQRHTASSFRGIGLGGAIFARSLWKGGDFANDVIGTVARGDIRSAGTITGDLAAQSLQSYLGYTALGADNHRKDAMLKLMQQITLLLRVSAAPNTMAEYQGGTPVKIRKAVEMAQQWGDEIVAIGVRHKVVLDAYAEAIQAAMPNRPLFVVTGSTTSFAKRRALRKTLRESGNGILLCTQQSLPSSVNFDFVNKIIIPELHFNNSGMSQFYMRFIRYTSTEYKDIYFLTYAGSLESNLMQMVVAKEKINLFMRGQDTDLDEIYERFGIDYNLLSLLMRREKDDEGHLNIRWGEQMIA